MINKLITLNSRSDITNKNTIILSRIKDVLIYTFLFLICLSFICYLRFSIGRTFIWRADTYLQHLKTVIYMNRRLPEILKGMFLSKNFVAPLWDMSIGEGADVINVFTYYGIADPFNIPALFVSRDFIYIYFHIAIFLRIYFCGLTFMLMYRTINAQDENNENTIIILCSLLYAFCSWNLFVMTRHHFFITPLIYTPLIIAGIEKIIRNEKTHLITIGVFLIGITNLYFLYMVAILVFVYSLVRVLVMFKTDYERALTYLFKIFTKSLIGLLLGAYVILPSAYYFLIDPRKGYSEIIDLLYPNEYYKDLIKYVFVPDLRGYYYWTVMGFGLLFFIAVVVLLFIKKERVSEKILIGIATIFTVFPFFAHVLNTFSYISNRWTCLTALLAYYIVCRSMHDIYIYIYIRRKTI